MLVATRPSDAISRICDDQNFIAVHREGRWFQNGRTGQRTHFHRQRGIYKESAWTERQEFLFKSTHSETQFARGFRKCNIQMWRRCRTPVGWRSHWSRERVTDRIGRDCRTAGVETSWFPTVHERRRPTPPSSQMLVPCVRCRAMCKSWSQDTARCALVSMRLKCHLTTASFEINQEEGVGVWLGGGLQGPSLKLKSTTQVPT